MLKLSFMGRFLSEFFIEFIMYGRTLIKAVIVRVEWLFVIFFMFADHKLIFP